MSSFNLPPGVGVHDIPGNEKPKREKPEKPKKAKWRREGQPAPVWKKFMDDARARIVAAGGFKPEPDTLEQIGLEIVRAGEGEKFLKSVRRGRSTQRQNARYQILRVVEAANGAAVPRRREDNNTPEARNRRVRLELEAYAEAGKTPAAAAPVVHQVGKIKRLVSMLAGKFRRAGRGTGV